MDDSCFILDLSVKAPGNSLGDREEVYRFSRADIHCSLTWNTKRADNSFDDVVQVNDIPGNGFARC